MSCLDQIFNENCTNKIIDLLTIDVEGYELEVLSGLDKIFNCKTYMHREY